MNKVRSMTAFSRVISEIQDISIEIKSVNHRFFDLSFKTNLYFSPEQEYEIKKLLAKEIKRGKVDLFIGKKQALNQNNETANVLLDAGMAEDSFNLISDNFKNLVENYKKIKSLYSQEIFGLKEEICVELYINSLKIIYSKSSASNSGLGNNASNQIELSVQEFSKLLMSLKTCIEQSQKMQEIEGLALMNDILASAKQIEETIAKIEILATQQPQLLLEKTRSRIVELKSEIGSLDESRLLQEVSYLLIKSDFSEEVSRIKSHLNQLNNLFKVPLKETNNSTELHGKKLDFLAQELNRETTTLLAKSCNTDITNLAMTVKLAIDKIREQAQNLE